MNVMRGLMLIMIYLLSLVGCTAGWKDSWIGRKDKNARPQAYLREKALDHEKRDELQQALFTWRAAAQLEPDNADIAASIKNLEQRIDHSAKAHYQKGLDFYRTGNFANARREFLITLRLSPTHSRARNYLKKRLRSTEQTEYIVRRGDSFSKIAKQIYDDPGKAYVLAHFNDLNPEKPLLIGKTLLLPVLESRHLRLYHTIERLLEQAEKAMSAKQYDKVIAAAAEIQKEIPDHQRARALADQAHLRKGTALMKQQLYLDALAQFKQISTTFSGRTAAIGQARNHLRKQNLADKMKAARDHLRNKSYSSAINITEEILARDPKNTEARQLHNAGYYALGRQLLEQDKIAQAIKMLNAMDKDFKDTKDLLTHAHGRLNAQAETYYRNGVKYFINEELEKAIEAWQKALAINPRHAKARQDMENAMRLLETWRGLDPP